MASTEEVADGLTAVQAYELDGYSSLPSANAYGWFCSKEAQTTVASLGIGVTTAFADALRTHGTHVEVVEVPGGGHEDPRGHGLPGYRCRPGDARSNPRFSSTTIWRPPKCHSNPDLRLVELNVNRILVWSPLASRGSG